MSNDKAVSAHYTHGALLKAIQASLGASGKTLDHITIEDLAPVDEFHIGGRQATMRFIEQLNFAEQNHILDVGCGLGGAARFAAARYNLHVTGIDLTAEYIETGKALCARVGLEKQVHLCLGSALSMPFQNAIFDGGFMMHVGMNIENKVQLFTEVYRVLRQGASLGVYDIMRTGSGELSYPLPWAAAPEASCLATPEQYKQAMCDAGFKIMAENSRREAALAFFRELRVKTKADGALPGPGLHILMGENAAVKSRNMLKNMTIGCLEPVEIVAQKC